ncbi:HNH endonuclease family protein [Bacillus kwashiorkori]|uniref:HNH endonuclease family protein n=1 Tax=Bacillus kwashiorkori TaxID=1522318 RepID=UPI0009818EF8|nr:HNH endonuclease family protein [Bacillus kwashiorkori]
MIIQKRKGSANYKDEYEDIFSRITGKQFINDVLIPYSEIYLELIDYRSYYGDQPKIIKILSLLNRIDNNDWIPVAMYYIQEYNEKLGEFLGLLEQFASIAMVLRKNFNWRMSKYSQILRQMEKGVDVFSRDSLLRVSDDDKRAVLEKLNGDVYTELKDTVRRYVLLRIDSLLTKGQPFYDHSVITVEHVLPQTPKEGSEWLQNFHDPSDYVHKLGNLVLLTRSKNSQARNYDFNKKKTSYFQPKNGVTTFALTTQVIQEDKWTPEVLEKRQWYVNTKLDNFLRYLA